MGLLSWGSDDEVGGRTVTGRLLREDGTPEGAKKGWETRKGGGLSVPEQHQMKIAKQTLKYSDAGASIMGGMSKDEARAFINKHEGPDAHKKYESEDGTPDGAKKGWLSRKGSNTAPSAPSDDEQSRMAKAKQKDLDIAARNTTPDTAGSERAWSKGLPGVKGKGLSLDEYFKKHPGAGEAESIANFGGKRAKPFGKAEALGGTGMSDEISPDSPQSTTLPGGDEESEAWYDSLDDGQGDCSDDEKDMDGNCPGDPDYDEYSAGDYYGEGEVAPPGREEQVKKLKQDKGVDNPFAVAWASYNKSEREARRVVQSEAVEADAAVVFRTSLRRFAEGAEKITFPGLSGKITLPGGGSYMSSGVAGSGSSGGGSASASSSAPAGSSPSSMAPAGTTTMAPAGSSTFSKQHEDSAGTDHEFPAPVDAWRTSEGGKKGKRRRTKQGEVPPGTISGDPVLSPTLSEDAEAGTSDGAKKGWQTRKGGGGQWEPAPGGGVRRSKVGSGRPSTYKPAAAKSHAARQRADEKLKSKMWTPEMVHRQQVIDQARPAMKDVMGNYQAEGEDAEGRYVAQAEAIGAGSMGPLMRKGARVPALKTDRGGVEQIPLASLKDDIRRKSSLRKMMSPDKTGKDEQPESKKASESVRAFEEAYA